MYGNNYYRKQQSHNAASLTSASRHKWICTVCGDEFQSEVKMDTHMVECSGRKPSQLNNVNNIYNTSTTNTTTTTNNNNNNNINNVPPFEEQYYSLAADLNDHSNIHTSMNMSSTKQPVTANIDKRYVVLIWVKEEPTLETKLNFIDSRDNVICLKWSSTLKHFVSDRIKASLGEHSGFIDISDTSSIVNITPFVVQSHYQLQTIKLCKMAKHRNSTIRRNSDLPSKNVHQKDNSNTNKTLPSDLQDLLKKSEEEKEQLRDSYEKKLAEKDTLVENSKIERENYKMSNDKLVLEICELKSQLKKLQSTEDERMKELSTLKENYKLMEYDFGMYSKKIAEYEDTIEELKNQLQSNEKLSYTEDKPLTDMNMIESKEGIGMEVMTDLETDKQLIALQKDHSELKNKYSSLNAIKEAQASQLLTVKKELSKFCTQDSNEVSKSVDIETDPLVNNVIFMEMLQKHLSYCNSLKKLNDKPKSEDSHIQMDKPKDVAVGNFKNEAKMPELLQMKDDQINKLNLEMLELKDKLNKLNNNVNDKIDAHPDKQMLEDSTQIEKNLRAEIEQLNANVKFITEENYILKKQLDDSNTNLDQLLKTKSNINTCNSDKNSNNNNKNNSNNNNNHNNTHKPELSGKDAANRRGATRQAANANYTPVIQDRYIGAHFYIMFEGKQITVNKLSHLVNPKSHIDQHVFCKPDSFYKIVRGTLKCVFDDKSAHGATVIMAGILLEEKCGNSSGIFKYFKRFEAKDGYATFLKIEAVMFEYFK